MSYPRPAVDYILIVPILLILMYYVKFQSLTEDVNRQMARERELQQKFGELERLKEDLEEELGM